jgi:Holliday junction resolvasome RuvABC endonuclease subunit
MSRNIVGIDPSLSGTAVCVYSPSQVTQPWTAVFSSKPTTGLAGRIARFQDLTRRVVAVVSESGAEAVFIEGHSFGSQGKGTLDRAEYRGILSAALLAVCGTVYEVPPLTLKLFVTGKGKGDKTAMITACVKRYGVEYGSDDEYDAYGLCRLGACVLGWEKPATEAQVRAMGKVTQ